METAAQPPANAAQTVWEPLPRGKCPKLATAGAMVEGFVKVGLFFGGLLLSVVICAGLLGRPAPLYKDVIWWVLAITLSCGPFLLFEWLLNRRHRRKLLSIDQHQVCFGNRCVPLAELKSVSRGQFKAIMERYFPSLEKAAVMAANPVTASSKNAVVASARQQVRDQSLTLTKEDGKQVHWIGALAYFEEAELKAFFTALRERKPDLELNAAANEG